MDNLVNLKLFLLRCGGSAFFVGVFGGAFNMRMGFVTRRLMAVVMGGVLVGGCGSISDEFGLNGVGIPATKDITNYYNATSQQAFLNTETQTRITVEQYLLTSITYTNTKCHNFFEQLEQFRQDRDFIDQIVTAALAAGSPWLALSNSAKVVAKVTSALSIGNQLNKYTADIYAFYTFRKSLKRHVFEALGDFQSKKGLDLIVQDRYGVKFESELISGNGGSVYRIKLNTKTETKLEVDVTQLRAFLASPLTEDLLIAQTIATDYAVICSLENLRRIIEQSLDVAITTADAQANPAAPTVTKTTSSDAVAEENATQAAARAVAVASKVDKLANRAENAEAGALEAKAEAKAAKDEAVDSAADAKAAVKSIAP